MVSSRATRTYSCAVVCEIPSRRTSHPAVVLAPHLRASRSESKMPIWCSNCALQVVILPNVSSMREASSAIASSSPGECSKSCVLSSTLLSAVGGFGVASVVVIVMVQAPFGRWDGRSFGCTQHGSTPPEHATCLRLWRYNNRGHGRREAVPSSADSQKLRNAQFPQYMFECAAGPKLLFPTHDTKKAEKTTHCAVFSAFGADRAYFGSCCSTQLTLEPAFGSPSPETCTSSPRMRESSRRQVPSSASYLNSGRSTGLPSAS